MGLQVPMALTTMSIFWNVTPRGLVYISEAWVTLSPQRRQISTTLHGVTSHIILSYRITQLCYENNYLNICHLFGATMTQ
jgi:hypothetical protein